MSLEAYYSGNQTDILVYVNGRGDAMAADFIDSLSIPDQKKAVRLLKEFADRGEIRNREKFRLEEPPIYALKSFQVRILCFFLPKAPKRTLVLTHGFIKKSDDAPTAEIERAKRIYVEVVESSGRRKHT